MPHRVKIIEWDVPSEILPPTSSTDAIYVLPAMRDSEGRPAYRAESMLLLKGAAAEGVPFEYALPPEERRFVDHFSADLSALEVWLCLGRSLTRCCSDWATLSALCSGAEDPHRKMPRQRL